MACMLDTEQPLCQNGYDGTVVVVVVVVVVVNMCFCTR